MLKVMELARQPYLQPVSFEVGLQEVLMVSGVSGSGKSVLLRALADLDAHEGEVWLGEQLQSAIKAPDWRAQVMWFPAETAWWADTVLEHFPPKWEKNNQAWCFLALEKVGLNKKILHQNVDALSSGEKQRLALIRGLLKQPKVLLLDEITANLDDDTAELVEDLVTEYLQHQQACAVWVSHDKSQVKRMADQHVELQLAAESV